MKLKKIIAITLATMLSFAVVGCSSSDDSSNQTSNTQTATNDNQENNTQTNNQENLTMPDEFTSNGTFIVGTSADYPPYEFITQIDGVDEYVGFDIELAKEIAKELGKELEIVDMPFNSLLLELGLDRIDMVIAGLSPTPERLEQVDMSEIYYEATHAVIVLQDNEATLVDIDALTGKTVGVQSGSIQEKIAYEQMADSEIISLTRIPNLILELENGKVDALVIEKPVAESYLSNKENLVIAFDIEDSTSAGNAVAVKKGSLELLEIANDVIERVTSDGTFDKWLVEATELASIDSEE